MWILPAGRSGGLDYVRARRGGPVTVAMLLRNILTATERQRAHYEERMRH